MKITQVKINGITNPVGYDFRAVKVSWKVEDFTSPKQKYVKIEIAKDASFEEIVAVKEGADLQSNCELVGMDREPRTRYFVRVSVTADNGDTVVSEVAFFETAKGSEAWGGKWIGTEKEDTFHPVFKKNFACTKELRQARIYICGLGLYEAYINGEKVGDEYLAPFYNDYDYDVQYQTYDITAQLKEDNTISVILGNGWYKGRFGLVHDPNKEGLYGDRFALIAELRLAYMDGTEEVIGTDETWTYCASDVKASGIYDGETYDHMLWAGKDNSEKAAVLYDPERKLTARFSMPLGVNEMLSVKEVIKTPAGETVLDFGQNFVGYVSFKADFPAGTVISLDYGEVLQQGNFYNDNYRSAKANFTYVSAGQPEDVRPHFTFYGGRFVRVTGWVGELTGSKFTGNVVYSRLDRTGFIETSNAKINQLASNCLWGQKGNFVDVPTDCPQRDERLGWTGDANVFSPTATYNMDTRAFYDKYMYDLRIAQNQMGGSGPAVAPICGLFQPGGCVWGDVMAAIPNNMYDYYGDVEQLKTYYPNMKDWVDYITRESEKNGNHHLFDFGFHFADWLALDGLTEQSVLGQTDSYYLASCYYYASTRMTEKAARICGYKEDEAYYKELAETIRQAIFDEYFSPNGRLTVDTQTGYIVALKWGLYTNKQKLIEGLASRLHKDGYKIKGGFIGATSMCTVLAENGFEKEAIRFLLNEDFPSWLHCVNLGATTIWERWNSILDDGSISGTGMNSLNHYSYGSVMEYVYKYQAGIKAAAPAFRRVEFKPQITGFFRYLNGAYDSASGKYVCNWKFEDDGRITVHVEVPFNCTAHLVLPNWEEGERELCGGVYDITYQPVIDMRLRFNNDSICLDYLTCPEAMEILKEKVPEKYQAIAAKDLEMLCGPLVDFNPFGPQDPGIAEAKELIGKIMFH